MSKRRCIAVPSESLGDATVVGVPDIHCGMRVRCGKESVATKDVTKGCCRTSDLLDVVSDDADRTARYVGLICERVSFTVGRASSKRCPEQ